MMASKKAKQVLAVSMVLLAMTAAVAMGADPSRWMAVKSQLHAQADERAVRLSRGSTLALDAGDAVLAADLSVPDVAPVGGPAVEVPANGVLTFAVDVTESLYVSGTLFLAAGEQDLRPGLRAYVLCNTTVVGAPMIHQTTPPGDQVDFDLPGTMPAREVSLRAWRLDPGRHYIHIAGPHFRPAGVFEGLRLQALCTVPRTPKYTFVQISDTHVFQGRSPAPLIETCKLLKKQGVAFAIIAGDLVDRATRPEFVIFADAMKACDGFPIYGCVGNHDAYHSSSRPDILELLPDLFPGGTTNYVLNKPPLRFIVVDGAYWMTGEGKEGNIAPRWSDYFPGSDSPKCGMGPEGIKWLNRTLAADTTTPTLIVSHFPFEMTDSRTQCGYKLNRMTDLDRELLPILKPTPNVPVTLSGHLHWNHMEAYENDHGDPMISLQGPAFCVWPAGYRFFRVYADGGRVHLEWEVRLVDNMGHVANLTGNSPSHTWKISTSNERDLTSEPGGMELTRRDVPE